MAIEVKVLLKAHLCLQQKGGCVKAELQVRSRKERHCPLVGGQGLLAKDQQVMCGDARLPRGPKYRHLSA